MIPVCCRVWNNPSFSLCAELSSFYSPLSLGTVFYPSSWEGEKVSEKCSHLSKSDPNNKAQIQIEPASKMAGAVHIMSMIRILNGRCGRACIIKAPPSLNGSRGVTIPALDPAPESDFNSFWDIRRFQLRIRILALMIQIHDGSGSTSGYSSANWLI